MMKYVFMTFLLIFFIYAIRELDTKCQFADKKDTKSRQFLIIFLQITKSRLKIFFRRPPYRNQKDCFLTPIL